MQQGYTVGETHISRLMKEMDLVCKQVRLRYFSTTNRKYKYYRNKVQRKFITESPNLIWVSDITHVYVKDKMLLKKGDIVTAKVKLIEPSGMNGIQFIITLGDFYSEKATCEPKRVLPTYMDGYTQVTDINKILPKFVCDYLKLGFQKFGAKIKGFNAEDIPLTGVETRTSAPIRILRGANYTLLDDSNVYPGGEGAGYAGGIMSAAIDGLNIALAILNKGTYEEYKKMER